MTRAKEEVIDKMFSRTVAMAAKMGLRVRSVDDGFLADLAIQSMRDGVHPNLLIRSVIHSASKCTAGGLEREIDFHWYTLLHVSPVTHPSCGTPQQLGQEIDVLG